MLPGVIDDGVGACRRAVVLGVGGRHTDLLGEDLDVWVLHLLGLVGIPLMFNAYLRLHSALRYSGLAWSSTYWATMR